jgi:nondiscriminating glutamyl-tRNA synthetase
MTHTGKVITRIAPSPTGFFHMGTLRTALFCYLFARKNKGDYLLRIEDTDKIRSEKKYEDDILGSLEWLGINHDAFFRQSEHLDAHRTYLKQLIADGRAYVSSEESKDNAGEMREVIRFKNTGETITFTDLILGDISVDTSDLGDFVIAKDFDTPLYNFAVVVDDINANITHVIRGQDHVSNTPRQILMYRALGKTEPHFAHIPLILAPDKQKLSKRKHGESVSVKFYREQGYLPEALINFMAFIGWNPGGEKELFTIQELIEEFSLERVQKSPGVFNIDKLNWMNKEYMKKLSYEEQEERIAEYLPESFKAQAGFSTELLHKLVPSIMERIDKFADVRTMAETGELGFFFARPTLTKESLGFKGITESETREHLTKALDIITGISESDWNIDGLKAAVMVYADSLPKRGPALHPLRYSLSGLERSPDPFTIASVIGREETLARIQAALLVQ